MIKKVAGRYMSGKDSNFTDSTLQLEGSELVVFDRTGTEIQRANFNEVKISTRIGTVPRRLNFPNFSSFETDENELVDQLIRSRGKSTSLLHKLEGKLHFLFLALVITVAISWVALFVGLPFLAKNAAERLPKNLLNEASQSTLEALDYLSFEPSQLPRNRQLEIVSMINSTLSRSEKYSFQILFRKADSIGANAFALPDGTIIFTDELIKLLKKDEEIFAVFAHELGHVAERHSLRQLLQSTSVAIISYFIFGEATDGLLETLNALPAFLMNNSYSREFENEADEYAIQLLKDLGISPRHLGNALASLSHYHSEEEGIKYLQTHPPTKERILRTKEH
jgi:Zn-dependent protease with chaperone function